MLPSASTELSSCYKVRRLAVITLTNLTFGNADIKSFLCSFGLVSILVSQLEAAAPRLPENLLKAIAHLFRNLAWKADKRSKGRLSDSGVVAVLVEAAMNLVEAAETQEESLSTLKVVLSALWNLSAHCGKNKSDICDTDGALEFLVRLLDHESTTIIESGSGILRNVSSFIATSSRGEEFR